MILWHWSADPNQAWASSREPRGIVGKALGLDIEKGQGFGALAVRSGKVTWPL
jgi:hypothetical protein